MDYSLWGKLFAKNYGMALQQDLPAASTVLPCLAIFDPITQQFTITPQMFADFILPTGEALGSFVTRVNDYMGGGDQPLPSGVILDLNASLLGTMVLSGSSVTAWKDLTNNLTFSQIDPANNPTLTTSVFSTGGVKFAGAKALTLPADFTFGSTFTAVMVTNAQEAASTYSFTGLRSAQEIGSGTVQFAMGVSNSPPDPASFGLQKPATYTYSKDATSATPAIFSVRCTGVAAEAVIRKSGVTLAKTLSTFIGTGNVRFVGSDLTTLYLGNSTVARILVFNRFLSDIEMTYLEGILTAAHPVIIPAPPPAP